MVQYFINPNDANFRRAMVQAGANMTRRQDIRQLGGPQAVNPNLWAQGNGQIYQPQQQSLPPAGDPYGLGFAQGPEIDARVGAVPGRMIVMRSGTATIASTDVAGKAIAITSAFTQADQDALGSGRRMEGILASCSVAGTFPSGYDAATLIQLALGMLVVKINVNSQLQDTIPFAAATDTKFNERYLRTNVRFDSGAFGAVSLGFDSLSERMPEPASSNYVLTVRAQCIFSPVSRRQRALQSQF